MAASTVTGKHHGVGDGDATHPSTRTPLDNAYQYNPLAERDIRLVRLYPVPTDDHAQILRESGQDEFRIDILHVPLESAPAFTAVSYTRGRYSRTSESIHQRRRMVAYNSTSARCPAQDTARTGGRR